MSNILDLSKPIPREWCVRGADSHVYRIGLSLFNTQYYYTKRPRIYHPLLIFISLNMMLIKNIISIYIYTINIKILKKFFFYLFVLVYFVNTGTSMKIIMSLVVLYSLVSQLINYQNYRNGIKPTDLRVFQMISGF